jgi:hypothetical protein
MEGSQVNKLGKRTNRSGQSTDTELLGKERPELAALDASETPTANTMRGNEDEKSTLSAEQLALAQVLGRILAAQWAAERTGDCQSFERKTAR